MSTTTRPGGAGDLEPRDGWPGRTAYVILALAVMAFALYGSLIPFDLRPRPLDRAWAEFLYHMRHPPRRVPRADFLANILLFVPIGFGLTGALLLRRRRWLIVPAGAAVLAISLAVSTFAEFLQVFAPGRVSSRHDVTAQAIGCLIGIAAWCAAGPALTRWLRAATDRSRTDRLSRILTGYVAAWIFVNLAPFNFTYDLGELARSVRTGRVTLAPFGAYDGPDARMVWDAFVTMISAAPLGLFGLVGWRQRTFRHGAGAAFGVGALLVACMEAAQIFVRAHTADSADVFFGWAGVAIGVAIGVRLLPHGAPLPAAARVRLGARRAAAGVILWSLVLCAYHWMPYDFEVNPAAIRRDLGRISLVPFAGYYSGSAITAFSNLLTRVGLSIPVGLLSAFLIRTRPSAIAAAAWVAAVLGLFSLIEAGQLFLPSRVPDPTDILVGLAGSLAGLGLGRWMQAATAGAKAGPTRGRPGRVL